MSEERDCVDLACEVSGMSMREKPLKRFPRSPIRKTPH